MKYFIFIIILFLNKSIFANELKLEINPKRPVAGEVFQVYFRVFTSISEMPEINFSPDNLEVVGKSNQGISTRTIYANGKLTITREITIVYDLVSSKSGVTALRNITVQLNNQTLRHPNVIIEVFKESQQLADVFLQADVSKKSLFVGEGVLVKYYLYSRVPVSNLDIKKYPKLNNFLKRFLQEPEQTERVIVDGDAYIRTQIYAAKLFPEKTGELIIDPLRMSVAYAPTRANDPFTAFGLNQTVRNKTLNSDSVKIEVRPLPTPVPTHFSGLVGVHEFQLTVGQNKLIVNEPLELKLTVTGSGALENMDAPELLKHSGLEEFESNGDLKIIDASKATKIFDYTYLAKENFKLPLTNYTLSYFDPDAERYVSTELIIPEITVAGEEVILSNKKNLIDEENQKAGSSFSKPDDSKLSDLKLLDHFHWRTFINTVNSGLIILAIFLILGWFVRSKGLSFNFLNVKIPPSFKKGNFDLREFLEWIKPLISETGKSPLAIIKDSSLSGDSKLYFIDLLTQNDLKEYSSRKSVAEFKYKAKYFKELSSYIESYKDAST
jgi:hypothetical protein